MNKEPYKWNLVMPCEYLSGDRVDKGNRLSVFLSGESEEEGRGKHSCEDGSDTSTGGWGGGGIKGDRLSCANNSCHPSSSLSAQRPSLAPALGESPSTYWPLHWSGLTSLLLLQMSLYVYWTSFSVGAWTVAPGSPRATVTTMGQQPDEATHTWQRSQGLLRLQRPSRVHLLPLHLSEIGLKRGLVKTVFLEGGGGAAHSRVIIN